MGIEKKEKDYLEYLYNNIVSCVEEEISIGDFKSDDVLIIKSAKDEVFDNMVKQLVDYNPNIKITVIGEITNEEIYKKYEKNIELVVYHGGRFINGLYPKLKFGLKNKYDSILFINYSTNRESYLNVESFCMEFQNEFHSNVYAYIPDENNYSKYKDLEKHILAMNTYCSYIYYLNYVVREEKNENRV